LNTTRSSFGTPVEEDEDDEGEEEYDEVSASSPINISDLGETLPRTAQGLNSLDHSGASNLRLGDIARGQFSASIPRNVAATSPSAFSPPSSSQRALEHYPSSAAMNHLFEEITRTIEVRPLQPLKKPWTVWRWLQAAAVAVASAGGGIILYRLVVRAPAYDGPEVNIRDKVVLVTEATSRMSSELLRKLAERNAVIILTSASVDDCENVRSKLMRSAGLEETHVDCRRLDLDSTRSIRRFAGSILHDYPHLDRLVLQPPALLSGVVAGARRPTHDAFEHQLGTNYFAFYLLTRLLAPSLRSAATDGDGARVVFLLDTRAAKFAEMTAERSESGEICLPAENWNWESGYTPAAGYQRSQWALRLFADELASRMANSGVSVLISDPGVNRTSPPDIIDHQSHQGAFARVFRSFGRGLLNLGHLLTRVLPKRIASTEFMCVVAEPPAVELTGAQSSVAGAPVYQDLQRCLAWSPEEGAQRQKARSLLWALSERWLRLDTHPEPVPLPPRFG
uniref:Retinol dehydrogenase 13 n=1 Tax=Schistocephalus solidus TaxID=70667 RepID=A0A183SVM1_SCHSO